MRHVGLVGMLGAAAILAAGCHGSNLVTDNGRCGPNPKVLVPAGSYPQMTEAGTAPFTVGSMTLDGSDLYVVLNPAAPGSSAGEVMRVSTRGGSPVLLADGYLFATPAFTSTSVILAYVNNLNMGSVAELARDGNGGGVLASLTTATLEAAPVTDGTSVYFVDLGGVESVPLSVAATPPAPRLVAPGFPTSLGVFGQHLLMLESDGSAESVAIGADAGAQVPATIGTGSAAIPGSLVPCGAGGACWLGTGVIEQADPAAGPVTTVATLTGPVAEPLGLAFDGTNFFVSGQTGPAATSSAIMSVAPETGAEVLVATLPASSAIAVDDACVYFSTSTGIFSLLKSATGAVIP